MDKLKRVKLIFVIAMLIFLINSCAQSETKQVKLEKTKISMTHDKTREGVEKVAQKFAIDWQNSNYEEVYDAFTSKLQALRSKNDFVNFIKKGGNSFGEGG